jgi:purine-binding chemotaxis protein CheW
VLDAPASEVRPVPDMGTTVDTEYLKGLIGVDERMVLLLDIDRLLRLHDRQMESAGAEGRQAA